jgi:hypothetical protein
LETDVDNQEIDYWTRPCGCRGSIEWCHQSCIKKWYDNSHNSTCPQCKVEYNIETHESCIPIILTIVSWGITCGVIFGFYKVSHKFFRPQSVFNHVFLKGTLFLLAIFIFVLDLILCSIFPNFHDRLDTYLERELGFDETAVYDSSFIYLEYIAKSIEFIVRTIWNISDEIEYKILDFTNPN